MDRFSFLNAAHTEFFAQLYADPDIEREPASGGRSMNGHFANRLLDENGEWKNLMEMKNTSSDISPTGSQMVRLVGLAYASKLYRENTALHGMTNFSNKGNEVAFGTIGNASCAEGMFFEALNAAGVLMVPMAVSIWDDGYGISVPARYQIMKENISDMLSGYAYDEKQKKGYYLHTAKGWDYPGLIKMYIEGIANVRKNHIPGIFHVTDVTQPQGHSTSGSHERYKSKERLQWEADFDCILKMKEWIIENGIATEEQCAEIEKNAKEYAREMQQEAWKDYLGPIKKDRDDVRDAIKEIAESSSKKDGLLKIESALDKSIDNNRKEIYKAVFDVLRMTKDEKIPAKEKLIELKNKFVKENNKRYNSTLYSDSKESALNVEEVKPVYSDDSKSMDGHQILNHFFDIMFTRDARTYAIGEDLGFIGDVNQGMAGMQAKHGEIRVTDTGIREATIIGQGIGTAMRGLRPIVEIQYLDYLLYAMQIISDDLATIQYRSAGGQKAPVIIRTRGHRLEGIWHSGSPMGAVIHLFRGVHVCVPRNMVQAGFYNTLLKSDEPGLIVERLNAYRLKEKLPDNIGEVCVPLGVPEVLIEGDDVTLVTYGSCVDIAKYAIAKLKDAGVSVELIDAQTLLPFDIHGKIIESLKKTNRIVFLDEDVPGGASAYMMQQVIDKYKGYRFLDSQPKCISSQPHRPAYGTDGDYFSKPNSEDVFRCVYEMMNEAEPDAYPIFY